jgi:hypothetical protein
MIDAIRQVTTICPQHKGNCGENPHILLFTKEVQNQNSYIYTNLQGNCQRKRRTKVNLYPFKKICNMLVLRSMYKTSLPLPEGGHNTFKDDSIYLLPNVPSNNNNNLCKKGSLETGLA